MKAGLIGPSYQERSPPFDNQRTVNLYPVVDSTKQGKEIAALYGTPGKLLFGTFGAGPVRGQFSGANDRSFVVSGSGLYETDSSGTATLRGTLLTTSGTVTIDENGLQLAVCDGTDIYILVYATNVFARVTDSDFPGAGTITFIDGYFAFNDPGTGKFYISALYDGTSIDALDFATAESSPDNLKRVIRAVGQLWLVGVKTTEIWTNTGASAFPFERINGARIEMGTNSPYSVVGVDNTIVFVGHDENGSGGVFRANGFRPEKISTGPIDLKIQDASSPENFVGFSYQQDGHLFYMLTGGGLETSLVYDFSTREWHERAYLNSSGDFETDLAICHMHSFGKNLVGDRASGNVYQLDMETYTDNGNEIKSLRRFAHIGQEGQRFTVNSLQVDFERGVGLTSGQGSAPVAALRVSRDGGQSWSNEYTASIGALGVRLPRCKWNRLGQFELATFEISITDPVRRRICGAYIT